MVKKIIILLAIKERDVVAIFQTGSVYLFRLISGMPSYGAQCVEGSQRFMAFVKELANVRTKIAYSTLRTHVSLHRLRLF